MGKKNRKRAGKPGVAKPIRTATRSGGTDTVIAGAAGDSVPSSANAVGSPPVLPQSAHSQADPSHQEPYISEDEDYTDSDYEGDDGYKPGGYHPVAVGDHFKSGRYLVLRKLGWGHFSTVWLVHDRRTSRLAALKVQKSASHYTEAARDEIRLLCEICDGDPADERACCRLLDHFDHDGPHGRHVCMVFEVLGENLLALVKKYNYQGVPLKVVRNLCRQILLALDYLHSKLEIIHTDLKPENVMLTQPINPREWRMPGPGKALTKNQKKKMKKKMKKAEGSADPGQATSSATLSSELEGEDAEEDSGPAALDVSGSDCGVTQRAEVLTEETLVTAGCKIVDFGNACWRQRHFTEDIQTRQYRSPEVILGQGYDTSTDMWSFACMVFELATGDLLFDPREAKDQSYSRDEDHLALMMELLGPMPISMTIRGANTPKFFEREGGRLRHIKDLKFWPLASVLVEKYNMPAQEAQGLSDFLMPMLRFAPAARATAADMLTHPWLVGTLPEAPHALLQLAQGRRAAAEVTAAGASPSPEAHSPAKRRRCRSAPSSLCGGDDTAKFARLNGYDERMCAELMRYAITIDDLLASAGEAGGPAAAAAAAASPEASDGAAPVTQLEESAWALVNSGMSIDGLEAPGARRTGAARREEDGGFDKAAPGEGGRSGGEERASLTGIRENTPRAANGGWATQAKTDAQPGDGMRKGVEESIVVVPGPGAVRLSDSCGSETLAGTREELWTLL